MQLALKEGFGPTVGVFWDGVVIHWCVLFFMVTFYKDLSYQEEGTPP